MTGLCAMFYSMEVDMHAENYGWGMGFWWSFMVLFWLLVIICIVYITTLIIGRSKKTGTEESAMDIVKKRNAQGEITREEFEKIREDLTKT